MNENDNEINKNINGSENNKKGINEDYTVEIPSSGYKENQTESSASVLEDNNHADKNDELVKKDNGGMRKRIVTYIIIGVICSTLGGVGSAIVTMNIMKNTGSGVTTNAKVPTNTKVSTNSNAKLITTNSTENLTVPEIVKKVSSSVVAISTNSSSVNIDVSGQSSQQEGVGTGIIFNENGYILTNYHVISGATNIKVMLSNGKEVSAKVVNYDAAADVAVIKLAANTKVPGIAEFGDSDNASSRRVCSCNRKSIRKRIYRISYYGGCKCS